MRKILLLVMFMGSMLHADPFISPKNCMTGTSMFSKGNAILNWKASQGSHTYYLQNTSQENILLNHDSRQGAQAGWDTQIAGQHVSILLLKEPNFAFTCSYFNTRLESTPVDCAKVLSICEMRGLTYPSSAAQGQQYWVIENQPANNVQTALQRRGIKG